jgi:predicted ribonuclease toxin of YeeF-YezG toxin-antitoxin module
MDKLAETIRAKQQEIEALAAQRKELAAQDEELAAQEGVAHIELRTLQNFAASLVEQPDTHDDIIAADNEAPARASGNGRSRGRQHWQITPQNRQLIAAMVAQGNAPLNTTEIADIAVDLQLQLTPKRAGDRMRKYVANGIAAKVGDSYRITSAAINGLKLRSPKSPSGAPT